MKIRPGWVKRTIDSYAIRLPVDSERETAKPTRKSTSRKLKAAAANP